MDASSLATGRRVVFFCVLESCSALFSVGDSSEERWWVVGGDRANSPGQVDVVSLSACTRGSLDR